MSGTNIFGNSPVSAGGWFASPWMKIGITAVVLVGSVVTYEFVTGQAHDYFVGKQQAPGQPPAQTSTTSTPFAPMPAPQADPQGRPKANGPGGNKSVGGGIITDDYTKGVISPIDGYRAHSASSGGGAPAVARSDPSGAALDAKRDKSALEEELTPTKFAASGVTELPHPDYLIEQGRILPCTQMTFANTTYAGSVTAIIPTVIKGSTGDVELIGAGATVFGTIEHANINGADRMFVLWQQITTPIIRDSYGVPHKYRVEVDSPASDQLGQTGLDGDLNRHMPSKFAAVIGLSLIDGVAQGLPSLMQRNGNNSNNFNMSFNQLGQGMQSGGNMLMQQFLNIPDVFTRLQGKACSIAIVRDLDMSKAYPRLRSLLASQRG